MKRSVALLSCLLLAVSATPAGAAKKKKPAQGALGPVSTVTSVGPTVSSVGVSSATATCPAGTQALGGGWTAPFGGVGSAAVYESYRSALNAWTVSGVVGAGSAAVTAFGYCRKSNKPISDVTSVTPLAPGAAMRAATSVRCPAGSRLVSGGFQSTRIGTSVGTPTELSASTPGLWSVRVVSSSAAGTNTITAHAYCMPKLRGPSLLNTPVSGSPALGTSLTATTFPCATPKKPKKVKGKKKKKIRPQRMSSGGFSSASTPTDAIVPVFTENRLDGSSWRATAVNAQGGGTLLVSAEGICS